MRNRLISSYAILQVNTDFEQKHYLDIYLPFAVEAIRKDGYKEISTVNIQNSIKEYFGLELPQNVIKTLVKRLLRSRYIVYNKGIYECNLENLPYPDINKKRVELERKYFSLLDKFKEFCIEKYNVLLTNEKAESALLSFINNNFIGVLRNSHMGEDLTKIQSTGDDEYCIAAFVTHIAQQDPEVFMFLENVVKGHIITDMLFLPSQPKKDLKNLNIYLDTPFVLRTMGITKKYVHNSCNELIELLQKQKSNIMIFEHTYNEILGVLEYSRNYLLTNIGEENEVTNYFSSKNSGISEIEIFIERLDDHLNSKNIKVVSTPKYEEYLNIDEECFAHILKNSLKYRNGTALYRDIQSLTAINRLRDGKISTSIDYCKAIFITTNTSLVYESDKYFRDFYKINPKSFYIPHCISDQNMAVISWLKSPNQAPDLPRHLLIANSYAILDPSPELWQKYLKK